MPKKLGSAYISTIIALKKAGMYDKNIASAVGVSNKTVYKYCKKFKLVKPRARKFE